MNKLNKLKYQVRIRSYTFHSTRILTWRDDQGKLSSPHTSAGCLHIALLLGKLSADTQQLSLKKETTLHQLHQYKCTLSYAYHCKMHRKPFYLSIIHAHLCIHWYGCEECSTAAISGFIKKDCCVYSSMEGKPLPLKDLWNQRAWGEASHLRSEIRDKNCYLQNSTTPTIVTALQHSHCSNHRNHCSSHRKHCSTVIERTATQSQDALLGLRWT